MYVLTCNDFQSLFRLLQYVTRNLVVVLLNYLPFKLFGMNENVYVFHINIMTG